MAQNQISNYPFVKNYKNSAGPYKGNYIDESSFMDWVKQYQGTDFYNQYLNAFNTYKSQNFTPNFFQSFGFEAFGDESPWNNFENSRLTTFFDSLGRIQDAQHQEGYNSAEQQTQRLHNAGQNPDLTGGVSAGDAGNLDNLETPLPAPAGPENIVGEVASSAMQVISLGMSLAQGIQGLNAGELQLGMDSIDLYDKSNKSILDSLGNSLTEREIRILLDPTAKDIDGNSLYSDDERIRAFASLSSSIDILGSDSRLPRYLRNKIKKSWRVGAGSVASNSQLYKLLSDVYSNKKNAIGLAGDPFNRGGFEECLNLVGDHIQRTIYDVQKLSSKFESDRLSVNHDGKSLGTLAGESDASAYTAEAYQKEYDAIVNKMWDDIIKDLSSGPDKDKWWSKVLRFAIPIVRLWLGNIKMPSVSHSTSTGIGSNGSPIKNSSTSFGF